MRTPRKTRHLVSGASRTIPRRMAAAAELSSPMANSPAAIAQVFEGNTHFVQRMTQSDNDHFARMSGGQAPRYLLIGCADSRVPTAELMGLGAGEAFVHRNVANQVVLSDLNVSSCLAFGVGALGCQDVIVCGHSECGGVKAASTAASFGVLDFWLKHIKDVAVLHAEALDSIVDPAEKLDKLIELNVQQQCINVYAHPVVQDTFKKTGKPNIHGVVYEIKSGTLKHVPVQLPPELQEIYSFG